jgi:hypothetical protein
VQSKEEITRELRILAEREKEKENTNTERASKPTASPARKKRRSGTTTPKKRVAPAKKNVRKQIMCEEPKEPKDSAEKIKVIIDLDSEEVEPYVSMIIFSYSFQRFLSSTV